MMRNFTYTIKDENGFHARPAGLLVRLVKTFSAKVVVSFGEKSVDATRLMALMTIGAKYQDTITVSISGEDEEEAFEALQQFFSENL